MRIFDIALLGTSLTAGSGASRAWDVDLERALSPGKQSFIRTYNHGLPGLYSANGLVRMPQVADMKPKAALIEFATNDCLGLLSSPAANIPAIVDGILAKAPDCHIFLMTMNPIISGRSTGATTRAPLIADFNNQYVTLAASLGVGLIDIVETWADTSIEAIPDGVHPTAEANLAQLVPVIAAALSPLIE